MTTLEIRKKFENLIKNMGGVLIDSGTFRDNSGSDLTFHINNKTFYIEITDGIPDDLDLQ